MKKNKLRLDEIKVESFITSLEGLQIQGAVSEVPSQCVSNGYGGACSMGSPCNTGAGNCGGPTVGCNGTIGCTGGGGGSNPCESVAPICSAGGTAYYTCCYC